MADINSNLPVIDAADGTDGVAAPSAATHVAGKDGAGNLQSILTLTSGAVVTSGKIAMTPASPSVVSVGVASTSVLSANANRTGLILVNNSAAKISIGLGVAAVLNSGITLYPGGTFCMDAFSYSLGTVTAIASVAASSLSVQEYS